jgi:UDP-galactopyranose mutase
MTGDHASALVLGAGPAGLTAGLETARRGHAVTVLEADEQVGGLARTVERDGFRFDLGGHRFFTKSPEVERLWHEVLGGSSCSARACRASAGTGASWTTR